MLLKFKPYVFYTSTSLDTFKSYKIIDVDYVHKTQTKYDINDDKFTTIKEKEELVKMMDYLLNSYDKCIYKKTDYLCNDDIKICIHNKNAKNIRKIYDGNNYSDANYVSFYRLGKQHINNRTNNM
jgi:hypothetical protein